MTQLEQTINDLADLHPYVETLAVVPVGLTKYRREPAASQAVRCAGATAVIDQIEGRQKSLLKRLGTRFVWPADEFYVNAGRPFPRQAAYEDMSQFENGIGMARESITISTAGETLLKKVSPIAELLMLTGFSAVRLLEELVSHGHRDECRS